MPNGLYSFCYFENVSSKLRADRLRTINVLKDLCEIKYEDINLNFEDKNIIQHNIV